ncbi:MAG: PilZ domain-containing protein [Magnetospiraceae bacterium]
MGQDKRKFERYELTGVGALIDRFQCPVINVSDQGVLLEDPMELLRQGDAAGIVLTVPLLDKIVPVEVYGWVVRAENGMAALNYDEPVRTWKRLLALLNQKQKAEKGND